MHYGVGQSGPLRIFPGRLSVSRSFGDPEAKIQSLGGNPNVLISVPEIKCFKIKKETDFILIGCDGIFDKLSNCDVIHSIWALSSESISGKDANEHSGKISDIIIRNCLASNANDNLTCIFICFENFKNLLFENNTFKADREKLDEIIKNIITINQNFFGEKESEVLDNPQRDTPPLSNNIQNTNNLNNTNHYANGVNLKNSQKNILNNINNNNANNALNENANSEKKKSKKNLQLNLNLRNNQPSALKIISPVNNSNINKFLSPTNNTINNLNQNFINNNIFNQTMSSNEDGIHNKKIFSNKNVNYTAKLDLISPKNSMNPMNKKSNHNVKVNIDDNKLKSLPAINVNGNAKKGNFN